MMTDNDLQAIKAACNAATSEPIAQLFQRVSQLEEHNARLDELTKVLKEQIFIKLEENKAIEGELLRTRNRLNLIESYLRCEGEAIES
ncbi:hypothetical protein J3998_03695 [Thiomicrorhabdus sp. 6S2-11]|uniref:DUF904 domain-containing protein n=1 Tax=Thiomicrorhabdus marina TaxID=2818442 RepID=A0ABS3Q308_9GAMM|nr:hypothetical protein [Thiomicrorhabdus marina]MBO1926671.1 hypothetical protein [Thiomicrorhabdus marina]